MYKRRLTFNASIKLQFNEIEKWKRILIGPKKEKKIEKKFKSNIELLLAITLYYKYYCHVAQIM